MKKLVLISAMAVFLSGMAAQAQSTISWDFDTIGDTESWHPVPDGSGSLLNGILVTNGLDVVVLTSPGLTEQDPGVLLTNTVSVPPGESWESIEVRVRSVDAGFPTTLNEDAMLFFVNDLLVFNGWDRVDGTNQWAVLTQDATSLGTNDITYFRIDPPALGTQNFEFDYIKLHTNTNAPPEPVYKKVWEFNDPGFTNTEGWVAGNVADSTEIAIAAGGSESVLLFTTMANADPQTGNYSEPANLESGLYWSTVEIRLRHIQSGSGVAWDVAGTLFLLNNQVLSANGGGDIGIGGSDWDTTFEANGWITTRFDISALGSANIFNMRIDPYADSGGRQLEVDYVRFETRTTPILPPAPAKLVHTWDFNSIGNTEGWADNGSGDIVGMTVANAISGSEVVLTSSDVQGTGDPMAVWNGPAIAAPGAWTTWEVRFRQLSGNPSDPTTEPVQPLDTLQVTFVANNSVVINLATEVISYVPDAASNGWVTAVFDISRVGTADLIALRIDPISNIEFNFEIDYTKVFSQGSKYDAWSQVVYGLAGGDALTTADVDGDSFNNLLEFAFGGDPTNAAITGVLDHAIVDDGGTSYFEYVYGRRTDSNNGVEYALEQKGDLVTDSWVDLGDTAEVGTLKVGDDHEVVTNRVETVEKSFFQVEVTGE